ncbi:cysteine desulfurase [Clostridium algidicarnis]|uniref:cysteine desulfurase n=2 Tax=Clostridium algidicarnis TaxID=37659 RepID=A0A2S6FW65_9CLOT|nr:cysteine desulfurase [Clostridium algidicarnis]MBU3197278.1 cysteine desulfurase [Clostridium algidicarnis]MBU3220439.1 cysteine desulfurase [Clostridium algidicarnis]PPK46917.1 cysteine desulfurase [Clostridium algidicarnis DSM 15099]
MNNIDFLKINKIREDFPILSEEINGHQLVYLDNGATTQRPSVVINAVKNYYENSNANPHRGAHTLSIKATDIYEGTREKVRKFINAKSTSEIIFTKNSTEALNLLANSYGLNFLEKGDEILISIAEHHSNLIPWQQIAKRKSLKLKYVYVNDEGRIEKEKLEEALNENTKIVSIAHMNNSLGVINDIEYIIEKAHEVGAIAIVDGAQSVPHMGVDVQRINADFLVFSGHKMLGPMGIGVLYGKEEILEKMPPFLFGGDMIEYVSEEETSFAELPYKFEAGTQNVEGAAGLSAAIDYIEDLGFDFIKSVEEDLTMYALQELKKIPYIDIYGPLDTTNRGGIISFNVKDVHPHDVATILDSYGVAIRAGHHCAQPFMKYMNLNSTCRISFYFYNTREEVDIFIEAIKSVRKWLGYGS